ncbi:adenosylcobinamide-GDP ribazoletransferase [Loktanella sp. R86503]|uniref:adenosylcobinamide-GDP ribazoletransferase n=1 Tax=Loktanella sp. R86503 TaxID=3093847 RepID=UPI0036D9BB90
MPRTTALMTLGDLPAAFGLLTRLPVRVDTAHAMARGARAAWAWPLAGLAINALAAGVAMAAIWCGLPAPICALLLITVQMIITGAMHEDGLADSIDGLWGGWDKNRRLTIMKDSQIGTYGVLALLISVLLRWMLWITLLDTALWPAALAIGALSRLPMIALATALPHARSNGLSHAVGRPPLPTCLLAAGISLGLALFCLGWMILPVITVIAPATAAWAIIARRKIGGQTGDILGASQQIAEIAALLSLAALA